MKSARWMWSMVRFALGARHLMREWQVGDGREDAVLDHVLRNAREGDPDHVLDEIDRFASQRSLLINIGDEKGAILDQALRRVEARRVLELGAYIGYSAVRISRQLPEDGHLYSVEFSEANARIARRIVEHAGLSDRVTIVVGYLGDGGDTVAHLEDHHEFGDDTLDLVFLDHDKKAYLPDLQLILDKGWLRTGGVAFADNVKVPGVPDYHQYMRESEGKRWRTTTHDTHLEYQSWIRDIVLESVLLDQ